MLTGQNQNLEGCKKSKAKESGPIESGDIVKQLRIEPEDTYYKNVLFCD